MYAQALRFSLSIFIALLAWPASAQPQSLSLVTELAPDTLDAEALRAALEQELGVPVARVSEAQGAHLAVAADSTAAVRVSFVRDDGARVERTLDVTSMGVHANETLGLVAANLVRDEASDLLASLRASQPAPPPPPPPTAAVTAAPRPPPPPPPPVPESPNACAMKKLQLRSVGLDVLPYVGMSTYDGTKVERKFSLSLFGGLTGGVRGAEVSGFVNLDEHFMCGAQFSGAVNFVRGPVQGVQFSLVNWASDRLDGAQFAMVNGAFGSVRGMQYGLLGVAGGDLRGAQLGLVNVTGGFVNGAQLGLLNVAGSSVSGAQLGLVNVAGDRVGGVQIGLTNVSSGETHGAQLGLTNISAGRVDGAMVGLVNVAEDADAAIGLVNVLWRGRTHLDVWANDFGMYMVGIQHGSRYVHNITGIGIGRRENRAVFAPSYGIGVRVLQLPRVLLDIDTLAYWLFVRDEDHDELDMALIAQLRIPISFRITEDIAVFAGPTVNVSIAEERDNLLREPSLLGSSRLTNADANTEVRLWPGFTLGARFF